MSSLLKPRIFSSQKRPSTVPGNLLTMVLGWMGGRPVVITLDMIGKL